MTERIDSSFSVGGMQMIKNTELVSFESVLVDLIRTLREERELLEQPDQDRFELLAIHKMQIFGRLNRFDGAGMISKLPSHMIYKIEEIDRLLSVNSSKLRLRIEALTEVSQTISRAMEQSHSDGTYNASGYR